MLVELETLETTYETFTSMSIDDPVSCAEYHKKHSLSDKPGWKTQKISETSKRLIRAIKCSRLHQVRAAIWYQYGFEVPRDYKDALRIDKQMETPSDKKQLTMNLPKSRIIKFSRIWDPHPGIAPNSRMPPTTRR